MIPFKINKKQRIFIPTSWEDLTVKQVEEIANEKEPIKILEILTGLQEEYIEQIFPYLDFINVPLELSDLQERETIYINKNIYKVPDLKSKTIGQKILFQILVKQAQEGNKILTISKELFSVYMCEEITGNEFNVKIYKDIYPIVEQLNFVDFYGIIINLTKQFENILIMEKDLNLKPTSEQLRANIQMFSQLGEMNTIDVLAGGDPTKYAEVEKLEYNICYWKLFKNKLNTIFENNYKAGTK